MQARATEDITVTQDVHSPATRENTDTVRSKHLSVDRGATRSQDSSPGRPVAEGS